MRTIICVVVVSCLFQGCAFTDKNFFEWERKRFVSQESQIYYSAPYEYKIQASIPLEQNVPESRVLEENHNLLTNETVVPKRATYQENGKWIYTNIETGKPMNPSYKLQLK